MKRTLFIILLLVSATTIYAQQPPPKTPKDPDSTIIINLPAGTNTQTSLDTGKIYTAVQIEPSFPGGQQKLNDYFKANLKYPAVAHVNNVQGKVFVTFVVERDGSLSNIKVLRGIGSGCDEEAIRLLIHCPKWNPGIQSNTAVRVQYMVPVTFQLQEER
jgi:protein TonB